MLVREGIDGIEALVSDLVRRAPPRLRHELECVLISRTQLHRRVRELAKQIEHDFAGRDLVVVSLLNGTILFLADLIRGLNLPLRLDFIGVSSYGSGTVSRELVFTKELRLDVRGRDVHVVQSGQANPNDHLMELCFMVDAARRASARSITAVLPYFPYGKGDKKDEPRVSIRARVVADILEVAGVDRVLTIDLHAGQLQGFFRVPVDNLYALPVFAVEAERLIAAGVLDDWL